jgi:hypothetical protein
MLQEFNQAGPVLHLLLRHAQPLAQGVPPHRQDAG